MPSRLPRRAVLLAVPIVAAHRAAAQTAAARRFPQPVVAGTMLGRQVLRPVEQQDVLGRVAGLVQGPGGVLLVIRTGGVLGFGARPVAVPLDAAALLGEHVALLDVTPAQLRALPDFDPAGTTPLAADAVVQVGLARPFH